MTMCRLCDQDMLTAASCTVEALHRDGRTTPTFPYGSDPGWRTRRGRCGDCGVAVGGFHHLGCDIQVCPGCRGQLITCGCRWDELRNEHDEDEAEEDDELDELDDDALLARGLVPLAAAVAPLRTRHHAAIVHLGAWCLEHGRPCARDVASLCLEVLERHRTGEGYQLDRPTVTSILRAEVWNETSMRGTLLPRGLPAALWSVLSWLHDSGRLAPEADPVDILREPLRCYGGLGADGRPMPPGADVEFACQCYVPHDPTLPPGMGLHVVGHDPETFNPFYAQARLHPRRDAPSADDLLPVLRLATQVRDEALDRALSQEALAYVGRVAASTSGPELWLYRHDDGSRQGGDPLALDPRGRAWAARPDRRFRGGFRWVAIGAVPALLRAGIGGRSSPLWDEPEPLSG
jgi:hypothetical protein